MVVVLSTLVTVGSVASSPSSPKCVIVFYLKPRPVCTAESPFFWVRECNFSGHYRGDAHGIETDFPIFS